MCLHPVWLSFLLQSLYPGPNKGLVFIHDLHSVNHVDIYTCMNTTTKKQRNDRTVLVIDSEKHKSATAIQLFVVVGDTSQ